LILEINFFSQSNPLLFSSAQNQKKVYLFPLKE